MIKLKRNGQWVIRNVSYYRRRRMSTLSYEPGGLGSNPGVENIRLWTWMLRLFTETSWGEIWVVAVIRVISNNNNKN